MYNIKYKVNKIKKQMPSLLLIFQAKTKTRPFSDFPLGFPIFFFLLFCSSALLPFQFSLLFSFLSFSLSLSFSLFPSDTTLNLPTSFSIQTLDDAVITLTPSHFLQLSFPPSMSSVKLSHHRTDTDN